MENNNPTSTEVGQADDERDSRINVICNTFHILQHITLSFNLVWLHQVRVSVNLVVDNYECCFIYLVSITFLIRHKVMQSKAATGLPVVTRLKRCEDLVVDEGS